MAVTVDEMHVEVQESQPAPAPAPSHDEQKKDVRLCDVLRQLDERKLRLRAD
jgi:hypothetical protein